MNESLTKAVINQLGYENVEEDGCKDTLHDVCNHGASGGYGQFVYYTDTCKFYDDNKRDIMNLLLDQMEEMGDFDTDTVSQFIASFNCLKDYTPLEVETYLTSRDDTHANQIENALAWYALEEVARSICDN